LCGDWLAITLDSKNGAITDARWDGEGCAISQAAADFICERLLGASEAEAGQLEGEDVVRILGIEIRPARRKCAELVIESLRQAMSGQ
jgi:nitrogen fixation NifU-like protein